MQQEKQRTTCVRTNKQSQVSISYKLRLRIASESEREKNRLLGKMKRWLESGVCLPKRANDKLAAVYKKPLGVANGP